MKNKKASTIITAVLKLLWTLVCIGFMMYFCITRNSLGVSCVVFVYSFGNFAYTAIRDARKSEGERSEPQKPVKDKRSVIGAVILTVILVVYILLCRIWPVAVEPATILFLSVLVILHILDFISSIRK